MATLVSIPKVLFWIFCLMLSTYWGPGCQQTEKEIQWHLPNSNYFLKPYTFYLFNVKSTHNSKLLALFFTLFLCAGVPFPPFCFCNPSCLRTQKKVSPNKSGTTIKGHFRFLLLGIEITFLFLPRLNNSDFTRIRTNIFSEGNSVNCRGCLRVLGWLPITNKIP